MFEAWSIAPDGSGLASLVTGTRVGDIIPSRTDSRAAVLDLQGGNSFIFDVARPLSDQEKVPIGAGPRPGQIFIPRIWTHAGSELVGKMTGTSTTNWTAGVVAFDPKTRRFRDLWPSGDGVPLRDGRRLLVTEGTGRVHLVDVERMTSWPLFKNDTEIGSDLALSPDERWL